MTKARDIADFKFENIVDTGTEGTKVASGTTAQRGSTTGQLRFNSDTGLAEYYTGSQFKSIDAPPTISSIDVTEVDSQAGGNQTINITGSGFATGAVTTFVGYAGTNFNASSTTVNSNTSITAIVPKSSFLNAQEPYGVKITNVSGLSATLADQINVDSAPTWSTASGSIATLTDGGRSSTYVTSLSATDPDGDTVTYAVQTGSIPTGLTLNANGTWSGTAAEESSDTTYNFTVRATANSKTADRSFSISVNAPVFYAFTSTGSSTWTVPVYAQNKPAEILIVAGGAGGGRAGGGGAGGVLHYTSFTLSAASYGVTVGGGGTGWTADSNNESLQRGGNSQFGSGVAYGGGGGGYSQSTGWNGGCGGGHGFNGTYNGGSSTQTSNNGGTGYGNAGATGSSGSANAGGGGGGAGAVGNSSSSWTGGAGKYFASFTNYGTNSSNGTSGTRGYFAGGGGGDGHDSTRRSGGIGGGGTGAGQNSGNNCQGIANTGGGGGAGHYVSGSSSNLNGGSGIVLVRV